MILVQKANFVNAIVNHKRQGQHHQSRNDVHHVGRYEVEARVVEKQGVDSLIEEERASKQGEGQGHTADRAGHVKLPCPINVEVKDVAWDDLHGLKVFVGVDVTYLGKKHEANS